MDNDTIKMTCLEGQPDGEILKRLEKHLIVKVASMKKVFLVQTDHTVEGATGLQAFDFEKEIVLPHGDETPERITDTIFALARTVEDLDKVEKIEKKALNNNMMALKFDMSSGEKKDLVPYDKHLAEEIVSFCRIACDDADRGTQHGFLVGSDGEFGMIALEIEPYMVFESLKTFLDDPKYIQVAFTLCELNKDMPDDVKLGECDVIQKLYVKANGQWWFGVLPYKVIGGFPIFGEPDWAHEKWTERMELDLARADIIKKIQDYGTAYKGKIKVQKYTENANGYFYEGMIDFDKLSDKLKEFLTKNQLNINKRETVNEHLKNIGKGISIEKDSYGFITVRAGSFFATGKRSKARAYVEALENIVENL